MVKRLFLCALALGAATLAHAQQTPPSMTEQHRTIRQGLEAERVPLKELIPAYGDAVASTYVQGSQCKTTISEAMPPLGNEKAHMKEVVIDWTKVTALKSQDDLPGWIIVGREGFADDQFFYAKASFSAVAQAMIDLVKACGAPAAANYAPKADVDPHAAHAPTTARAPVAKSAPASAAKAPVARSTPAPAAKVPAVKQTPAVRDFKKGRWESAYSAGSNMCILRFRNDDGQGIFFVERLSVFRIATNYTQVLKMLDRTDRLTVNVKSGSAQVSIEREFVRGGNYPQIEFDAVNRPRFEQLLSAGKEMSVSFTAGNGVTEKLRIPAIDGEKLEKFRFCYR